MAESKNIPPTNPETTTYDGLTREEEALVRDVMAQHPGLTREEAIEALREAGM